eukprot:SAG31_NODE_35465_length_323_cov_0.504464_2_plen_26_part_01
MVLLSNRGSVQAWDLNYTELKSEGLI